MDPGADAWGRLARFAELVQGDPRDVPVDSAALAMAEVLRSDTDASAAFATLDQLAVECPDATFDGLRRYLFEDLDFRGDREHYDDPRNSFLDVVLGRRTGLPILLATVMMEVGRRADVPVVGVGMPMHFLVRCGHDADHFADPFTGDALDAAGVRQLFETIAEGRLRWDSHYLEPFAALAIISRMLANLYASYRRRRDPLRLALVARMRTAIPELKAESRAAAQLSAILN
jgi:regulator of sirC expression with transglutaminase-like and TPR domain